MCRSFAVSERGLSSRLQGPQVGKAGRAVTVAEAGSPGPGKLQTLVRMPREGCLVGEPGMGERTAFRHCGQRRGSLGRSRPAHSFGGREG